MGGELLESLPAPLWPFITHELHLVELVQPQEPTRVLSRSSRLAAKAGGVGDVADGQVLRREQLTPVEVRDGNLRGWNEPEVVALDQIRLFGELRELAGAGHRLGGHEVGDSDLLVATPSRVRVDEEVDEHALQPRSGPA